MRGYGRIDSLHRHGAGFIAVDDDCHLNLGLARNRSGEEQIYFEARSVIGEFYDLTVDAPVTFEAHGGKRKYATDVTVSREGH